MTADVVDDLIRRLGEDLRPVVPLRAPQVRAAGWLALVLAVGVGLACVADLPAVAARLSAVPDMWLAVAGSSLTAVLAASAAFQLSLPDRGSRWAWLPVPALALWLGASGLGCLRSSLIPGLDMPTAANERGCMLFIVGVSVPLSVAMLLMIRRGYALRPDLAASLGGLAVAAASATLLILVHPHDASASDLMTHVAAVAAVIVVNRLVGGRMLSPEGAR